MNTGMKVTFDVTANPKSVNTLLRVGPDELLACRLHKMSKPDLRHVISCMQSTIDTLLYRITHLEATIIKHRDGICTVNDEGPIDDF